MRCPSPIALYIRKAWQNMRARCYNTKHPKYRYYGGRGIKVCARWLNSVQDFADDMGPRPSDQHTLGRIDNDGDYEPGNCRWETQAEQQVNRSNNRHVTVNGETKIAAEWARANGLTEDVIAHRINDLGWSEERAVTTPKRSYTRRA